LACSPQKILEDHIHLSWARTLPKRTKYHEYGRRERIWCTVGGRT